MLKGQEKSFPALYTILMRFKGYSYTFYKNKDKMKKI